MNLPKHTQVLVIGGGPGGSTAAALLAREGFEVTLLERSVFPRYHIGESLLPTILPILDLLGAREKVEALGFQRKQGAYLEWGAENWSLNFGELSGNTTYAFQIIRSEFDHLLLEHAKEQGVKVFEGVEIQSVAFDGDRPRSARWAQKTGNNGGNGAQGDIDFDFLIDASGRSGVMATRYLRYFEKTYRQAYLRFLVFLSAFYDVGRTKEAYFWKAQRLTDHDASTQDLKHAFLKLVTGVKDMADAQRESTHHLILQSMTKRIDENLALRKDKQKLAALEDNDRQTAAANAQYFSSVEGLFALNEEEAVDGLYVATRPRLGLARAQVAEPTQ